MVIEVKGKIDNDFLLDTASPTGTLALIRPGNPLRVQVGGFFVWIVLRNIDASAVNHEPNQHWESLEIVLIKWFDLTSRPR